MGGLAAGARPQKLGDPAPDAFPFGVVQPVRERRTGVLDPNRPHLLVDRGAIAVVGDGADGVDAVRDARRVPLDGERRRVGRGVETRPRHYLRHHAGSGGNPQGREGRHAARDGAGRLGKRDGPRERGRTRLRRQPWLERQVVGGKLRIGLPIFFGEKRLQEPLAAGRIAAAQRRERRDLQQERIGFVALDARGELPDARRLAADQAQVEPKSLEVRGERPGQCGLALQQGAERESRLRQLVAGRRFEDADERTARLGDVPGVQVEGSKREQAARLVAVDPHRPGERLAGEGVLTLLHPAQGGVERGGVAGRRRFGAGEGGKGERKRRGARQKGAEDHAGIVSFRRGSSAPAAIRRLSLRQARLRPSSCAGPPWASPRRRPSPARACHVTCFGRGGGLGVFEGESCRLPPCACACGEAPIVERAYLSLLKYSLDDGFYSILPPPQWPRSRRA